ncbi:MAG: hypothetical protein SGJ27_17835 [Candidatus Melainabacteria bacterium]|nr:hypothetical protein [Candidatus Melainabacteria bacterium]
MLPDQAALAGGNSFHWSVLILAIVGVALLGAAVIYGKGTLLHKYQAFLAIIAFSTLYGALGNFFFNFWKFLPGGFVGFSYAQLGVMELGGLCAAMALFKLEQIDNFAAGGLERLQKGGKHHDAAPEAAALPGSEEANLTPGFQAAESAEDFMKSKGGLRGLTTSSKTDLQAVVSPQEAVMAKKGGPTSAESVHAIMTPPVEIDLDASDEMLSGPLNPSPTTSAPAARAGSPAPAAPTNATSNRLQAQKRRDTSTFTKLQALSASGTGSLKPTTVQQDHAGGGDLRSLLDRLDSEPEDVDYESLPTPEEIRVAILFSEETVTGKADAGKPKGFIGTKRTPLGQAKPVGKEPPKPLVPTKPAPATAGGAGAPIGQKSDVKPGGLAGRMQQNKPPSPIGGSPGLSSLLDRAEANSGGRGGADETIPEPTVAAAPEVQPTVEEVAGHTDSGLLAQRFMALSGDDEDEEVVAQPVEAKEEDEKVFAENVDTEIDDIFSSLAPAEAQREVADEEPTEEEAAVKAEEEEVPGLEPESEPEPEEAKLPEPEEEQPEVRSEPAEEPEVTEAVEEESEGLIFNQGIDNDLDDVFSNLAPAEAQRTIADFKPKPEDEEAEAETQEEPAKAEAPAEEQEEPAEEDGLIFNKGVDEDLDDLFSNLAPAEAQLNVADVKLKAKEAEPADDQESTSDFTAGSKADAAKEQSDDNEEEAAEDEGLFKLGDSDVDDIFAGLAGEQLDVNAETLAKVKDGDEEPELAIPASLVETGDRIPVITAESAQKTAKQTGDMPAMSKEQAAKIKDDIKKAADGEDEDEEEVVQEAVSDTPEAAKLKKELKEFGKLSGRSATAPKATGDSVGTMKTIGKLLIDNQAIENIIKAGEQRKLGQNLSTARIISSARGQGIMELLHKIDKYEGVVGSIIVGHDGLVMASTLKEGWDKDIMGALSTALLSTSNLTTKKLEIGKLRQMIMLTKIGNQEKTTVLTDVDVGILAVFVEETDVSKIDGMLEIIHKTIHG